jgi:hypothetical protein
VRDRLLLKYTGTADQFAEEVPRVAPSTTVRILPPGEPLRLTADATNAGAACACGEDVLAMTTISM